MTALFDSGFLRCKGLCELRTIKTTNETTNAVKLTIQSQWKYF